MEEVIFKGYRYTKAGNRIEIVLEDDHHLYVVYPDIGEKTRYNEEYYFSDSDFYSVKLALQNEGFRID